MERLLIKQLVLSSEKNRDITVSNICETMQQQGRYIICNNYVFDKAFNCFEHDHIKVINDMYLPSDADNVAYIINRVPPFSMLDLRKN